MRLAHLPQSDPVLLTVPAQLPPAVAALHGAWNFAQGNIVGVAVSGQNAGGSLLHFQARSGLPDWLSGGAFGLEGNIVTCLVLLVGIIILRLQLKKENF